MPWRNSFILEGSCWLELKLEGCIGLRYGIGIRLVQLRLMTTAGVLISEISDSKYVFYPSVGNVNMQSFSLGDQQCNPSTYLVYASLGDTGGRIGIGKH